MARIRNNLLGVLVFSPGLVVVGTLALWQNEGRFDYGRAAAEAHVIGEPADAAPGEAVSLTGALDLSIPVEGLYVEPFAGYHVVERRTEIYSWDEEEDSEGDVTWELGWHSRVDSNSRNSDVRKRLSSGTLSPSTSRLGGMSIARADLHFVDEYRRVPLDELRLSEAGIAAGLRRTGSWLYLGASPSDPALGDERVYYTGIPTAPEATYFGVVSDGQGVGRQFVPVDGFVASLIQNDGILHHLVNGPRAEALDKVQRDFALTKWITRAGGTLAIVIGLSLFFQRFAGPVYHVPVLRALLRTGALLLAIVLGVPWAVIVIVASMTAHLSPVVLAPLLLVVVVLVYVTRRARETGRRAEATLRERVASRARELEDGPEPVDPAEVLEGTFSRLLSFALVEGGLDRREAKFLIRWGEKNGIARERMEFLLSEIHEAPASVEASSREELETLALMALADGVLSNAELRALERIARKIGLGQSDLDEILDRVEARPAA